MGWIRIGWVRPAFLMILSHSPSPGRSERLRRWQKLSCCAALACALSSTLAGIEHLDRGLVAFPSGENSVYIGWRLLASDQPEAGFDVYRRDPSNGTVITLNSAPITTSTNFVDTQPGTDRGRSTYAVRPAGSGPAELAEFVPLDDASAIGGVRRLRLQGDYAAQKVALADLDGDGRLDYVIKQPAFNVDPYFRAWRKSPSPYQIEAYSHDGTFLWRHDMGPGIETGIWYSPFVVYDIDGDGYAEVYAKAGPADDPRDATGKVTTGAEYLVKLDGRTGKELARLEWPARDDVPGRWHDMDAYSYYSRNLMGVAYLDGQHPHLIVERGTYTLIKIRAYDPALNLRWSFETRPPDYDGFRGQGTHGMQLADIDADGRDEVIIGAAAIDDDGRGLWSTGRGHPDTCYVGDIDPVRPGLEIFYTHEYPQQNDGLNLVDARTGATLWGYQGATVHVHGQGFAGDIDASRPGMEVYGGEKDGWRYWLYDARGTRIGDYSLGGLAPHPVWWTAGPAKAIFARDRIFTFNPPPPGTHLPNTGGPVFSGPKPAAGIPAHAIAETHGKLDGTIIAIGDFLGDWREEVVVSSDGELSIHSTTLPAESRRRCLLQDRQYRTAVATQTMGYLYTPITGGQPLPELEQP